MSEKNTLINTGWEYVPCEKEGIYKFNGNACPTKGVITSMGSEGVKQFENELNKMFKWRETMFGKESKKTGFYPLQQFYNRKVKQTIVAIPVAGRFDIKDPEVIEKFENNEKLLIENYVLMFMDEIFGVLDYHSIEDPHCYYPDDIDKLHKFFVTK